MVTTTEPITPTRIARGIRRRLGWLGMSVVPLYLTREDAQREISIAVDPRFLFAQLGPADNDALLELVPRSDREVYLRRFRAGKLCFAVRDPTRLIAKVWCDLDEISSPFYSRRLEPHEAFFFDVYCHPDYRGRNLTPWLRLQCYAALRERGRLRYFSVTGYFNRSARNFKRKLGAINECLLIQVNLFGRYRRTWMLRL